MLETILILIAIFVVGLYSVAAHIKTKELEEKFKELKEITERSIKLNSDILSDYNKHSSMTEDYMSRLESIAKADRAYENKKIESLFKLIENFEKKYGNDMGE
jgi:vancomycin permeability regulator SanA